MSKEAKEVELVVRSDGTAQLYVDGKEFPWDVLWDDLAIESSVDGAPVLRVSILAERVISRLEDAAEQQSAAEEPADETPAPGEWELGWRFVANHIDSSPPARVLRLRCVADEGDYPSLQRTKTGSDLWVWGNAAGVPYVEQGYSWQSWLESFGNREFEVVEVQSADD